MTSDGEASPRGQAPLFLLSFRQRDEMAGIVARGGWQVVAARRGEEVERRFRASGAAIALIDARGAADEGLVATRALAGAVDRPASLLVCVSRADVASLGAYYEAGATHFLASPFGETELLHALRFAGRGVERREEDLAGRDVLGWRWDAERRRVQLSPLLARLLNLPEQVARHAALRSLAVDERRALFDSLRAMVSNTALVQTLPSIGRAVQHLQRDERTGRVLALVEPLGAPDVSILLREAMPRLRDAAGLRRWIDHALTDGGAPVHVARIRLARLDIVNMAYGRAAGDRLLHAVARRIEEVVTPVVPSRTAIARLEGADFAIAARAPLEAGMAAIEAAMTRPFVVEGELMPVDAGITLVESQPGEDAATLLRRMDDPPIEAAGAMSLDALAVQLRDSMEAGHIEIVWQPQVAIASGRIIGVEALARWRHPELGELGAETLFAAAERAGLTLALSDHIQARALGEAARWPEALAQLRLSINVTAGDVARIGFADILIDRVDASGFPRTRLTIEITESGLIEELGEAARLLAELRRAGCRVAIDDFGTGYSSLAYLKALPLDYLKIDKTLSQDIAGSPRDRIVVRGVIDMARSLGLSVVAEGVETDDQLELLAKEGCQYFQGFLCAPPLSRDALEELVGA